MTMLAAELVEVRVDLDAVEGPALELEVGA
jgi:hypothetical protein